MHDAPVPIPRSVVNRACSPQPAVTDPAVTDFHRGLPGYAPTPLRSLPVLAGELGVAELWVKDESDRFGLPAFKILGASWAVAEALRRDPAIRTLVTASAGNHGRAVARRANACGLACRVYLPAGTARARVEAISAEGADVVQVSGDYNDAVRAAAQHATAPGTALIADVAHEPGVASPEWVVDGYATLFAEITPELPGPLDAVLVPIGVGSLAAAAVRWAAGAPGRPAVVGVEPRTAACVTASLVAGARVTVDTPGTIMAGLDCATPSASAWPALLAGLTGAVTVDDGEVGAAVRDLAAAGLTVGPCGAAPVAALRALLRDPRCAPLRVAAGWDRPARVLCLATEGATDPELQRALLDPQ